MSPITPRKSLLLVAPVFPPSHGGGGLRIFRMYQKVGESLDLDIVVVTEAGRHYQPGWSDHDGWPVFALPADPGFFEIARALPRFLSGAGKRHFSAMHLLGNTTSTRWIGLLGLIARIPLIVELTVNPSPLRRTFRARVAQLPFRNAVLPVALNKTIHNWFLEIGVRDELIWERPNPVDTRVFTVPTAAQRNSARAELNLPSGATVHLVLGRFQPRKNQRFAVDVLSRLPASQHLLLVGPVFNDDKSYFSRVLEDVEAQGVGSRVTVIDRHVDKPVRLYHAADQVWLPSTLEGLPNVMLEALCCGLPVLANRALGLEAYLNGDNGCLLPLNSDAFAKAALSMRLDCASHFAISTEARAKYDADVLCAVFAARLGDILHQTLISSS